MVHLFRSEVSGFKLQVVLFSSLFYSCVYTVGRFRSFTLRRYRNVVFSSFKRLQLLSKWPKLTRRDVTVFTFPLPEATSHYLTLPLSCPGVNRHFHPPQLIKMFKHPRGKRYLAHTSNLRFIYFNYFKFVYANT